MGLSGMKQVVGGSPHKVFLIRERREFSSNLRRPACTTWRPVKIRDAAPRRSSRPCAGCPCEAQVPRVYTCSAGSRTREVRACTGREPRKNRRVDQLKAESGDRTTATNHARSAFSWSTRRFFRGSRPAHARTTPVNELAEHVWMRREIDSCGHPPSGHPAPRRRNFPSAQAPGGCVQGAVQQARRERWRPA